MWIEYPRDADVQPELVSLGSDRVGVAEQRQIRDLATEQGVGRPDDALLFPLGQHDVATLGPGTVEQLVLEHQRRDDIAARNVEPG